MKKPAVSFSNQAVKVGLLWALAAAPLALGFGAVATEVGVLVQLFAGSKWFTFKAALGAFEIVVFGLAAGVAQQRIASRMNDVQDSAA